MRRDIDSGHHTIGLRDVRPHLLRLTHRRALTSEPAITESQRHGRTNRGAARVGRLGRTVAALLGLGVVMAFSARPADAQTTYTWIKSGASSWATANNWSPSRSSPNNADILVFDGAVVAAPVVTNVPTQQIGRIRFVNNVTADLSAGGAVTLTISGTTLPSLDLQAGSTVTLTGNTGRPITLSLGNSSTATIAGSLVFNTNAHSLISSIASAITVVKGGSITAGTAYSGNVFGTSGTANVAVFQSGSSYIHIAGNTPFGLTAPSSRVVFNPGSKQFWRTTAGFQTDGRTYGNLTVQNNTALSAAGTTLTFQVDTLTVESGSSFTHTGSSTGAVVWKGDLLAAGTGGVSITPGSGGLQINGGKVQTIAGGGSGTITFGGNPVVASGTTLAVDRALTFSTGSMTVNGTFRFDQGGTVSGGGNFTYGAGATLAFAQTSGSYGVSSSSTFWPAVNSPTNVTAFAAGVTMNAGASRTIAGTLDVSGPVTGANLLTLTGTLRMNAGAALAASPVYSGTPTLVYASPVTVGGEWAAGTSVGAGVPNHVTLQLTGTLTLPGASRSVPGNLTITSGTLALAAGGDLKVGGNWSDAGTFTANGRPVTFTGAATQTLSRTGGESFATLILNKSGGSVQLGSAVTCTPSAGNALQMDGTTDVLDLNNQSLTLNGPVGGADASGAIKGGVNSAMSLAMAGAAGTLRFVSGSQSLGNLTVNLTGGAGGVTLGTPLTINGALTLTAGTVSTGANTLAIAAVGSVARTAGWVNGNLVKSVATGSPSLAFEVGSATGYTPVAVSFAGVTVGGTLTAKSTDGDHASIATSGIDPTKSVNRFWTLTGAGLTFTSYAATFTFLPGDVDAGANTDSLESRVYNGATWSIPGIGARTATSTQATGLTGFGDVQLGEPKLLSILSSAGANGTIAPLGATSVKHGHAVSFTMTPNVGYHMADVQVDGGSVGAVTAYTFTAVTANHTIAATFAISSFPVTVVVNGAGTVTRDQPGPTYPYHTFLGLTATPLTGNAFASWSQDVFTTYNPVGFYVDSAMTVVANFQRKPLDYVRSSFTATYQPISTASGATRLFSAADDSTQTLPLPFNFTFSGIPYPAGNFLAVNANGFAYFSRAGVTTSSPSLAANLNLFQTSAPNGALAPWYDDLSVGAVGTNPAGSVLYQTQGLTGSRTFTVQWTNVSSYNSTLGGQPRRINFQVILYEASQTIEFRYGTSSGATYSNLESASIGVEDSLGGNGNYIDGATGSHVTNQGMLTTNKWPTRHIRFTPGTPTPLAAGSYSVGIGQTYTSLTDAVADLNQRGVAGAVTFQLTDAVYDSSAAHGGNLFPVLIGPIAGASSTNTVTIQSASTATLSTRGTEAGSCGNQVLSNVITTSNEPILGLVGADYVTLHNLALNGGNLVDRGLLLLPSSTSNGSQNNTFRTIAVALNRGNTSSVAIQQSVPSAPANAAGTNSFNQYLNLNLQNAYAGISLAGNINLLDDGNVIGVDGGSTQIGVAPGDIGNGTVSSFGVRAVNQADASITFCDVRGMTVNGAGSVDGIVLDNSSAGALSNGTCTIANNLVHDLLNSSTSGARVAGIRVNQTANPSSVTRVYDNFVFDLFSSTTITTQRRIDGIMVQDAGSGAGATTAVDFNSVRLQPTTTNCSSACFEVGPVGPTVFARDNVFANVTSAQSGAAKHYCWVAPGAGQLGAAGSVSDYNVLFIANAGNGFVGLAGADKPALSDWQAVAGNDAHSNNADPQFVGPSDLHINVNSPTPVAQAGSYFGGAITWVPRDIDFELRSAMTPDIGADEGVFQVLTSMDIAAVTLVDPADGGTKSAGVAFTPQATFSNTGTNVQNNVPVRYRIRGPLPDSTVVYNQTFTIPSLAPGAGQTVSFPSASVAASGAYQIQAIAELPGDLNSLNDVQSGSLDVAGPLAGTYSIGGGQPFPFNTLTNAITRLNTVGVTGAVTYQLIGTSYGPSETFPITLNAYPNESAANTFTLKPAPGVTASITGASTRALIVLNGADYVTIDGSNNGGTSRDLTLTNTSPTTSSAVVWGQTTSGSDPATSNTVKNLVVIGDDKTLTLYGIGFGGSTIAYKSSGSGNNGNRVQNCDVRRAQYGIYSAGASAAAKNTGTVITQNRLDGSGVDALGVGGVWVRFEDNVHIDHNRVANLATSSTSIPIGISLGLTAVSSSDWSGDEVTNAMVDHNLVNGVSNSNLSGLGAGGIAVVQASSGTTTISDNMVTQVTSPALTPDMTAGILVGGGAATTRVWFNSVSMTGARGGASGGSFCLAIGGSNPIVDVRDNAFYTNQTSTGAGDGYLIGLAYSAYTNLTSDYNDLYSQAAQFGIVGGLDNSPDGDKASLGLWRTTTATDAHSFSLDPLFISNVNDLHIGSSGSPLANIGVVIPSVTDDFDGEAGARATTPDVGADEFVTHAIATTVIGSGSIAKNPDMPSYISGSSVQMTAFAGGHYHFLNWSGDLTGSVNPQTLIVNAEKSVTATFALDSFTVALTTVGSGTAAKSPNQALYQYGTPISMSATPGTGYHFVTWTGDTTTTLNPYATIVTRNRGLEADFAINTYTVTTNASTGGTVVRAPDNATYDYGTALTLTATPGVGYHFVGWSGDTTTTGNPLNLVVVSARSMTATFAINTYTLAVASGGNGAVAAAPVQATYDHGTQVTLTGTPSTGYHFVSWTGDTTSTDDPLVFRMVASHSLTGTFAINTYALTTTVAGEGVIGRNPDLASYPHGTSVQLTATPNAGHAFVGWAGDTTTSTNPLSLTMVGPRSLTAVFTDAVNVTIVGNGTVSKVPDQTAYPPGSSITMTATPAAGSHFVGWSGDTTTTTNPLTVNITRTRNFTATFALNIWTLTVNRLGNGQVAKSPDQATYNDGTSVQLTATPDPGNAFVRWSGAASGGTSPTSVVMNGDKTVTATFTVTLALSASGSGTAAANPNQPNYVPGTLVQLTATPGAHYHFVSWGGDTASSANPLTIAMSANRSLVAQFAIDTYTLTAVAGANGAVGVAPSQASYPWGTGVSLTATPAANFHFVNWTGDSTALANPLALTIVSNRSLTANFAIDRHTLTVVSGGNGLVAKSPDQPLYDHGTQVTVTATANAPAYHFVNWSGDTASTSNPMAFNLVSDRSLTATFALNEYPLTNDVTGSGTVARNPDLPTYTHGSSVQLTATPSFGWHFTTWTGDVNTNTNPVTVVMDGPKTVDPVFDLNTYAVSVSVPGGHGTVLSDPDQPTYTHGQSLELYASADPSYHFVAWGGDASGTDPLLKMVVDGPKNITATFAVTLYTLDLSTTGPGTITPTPNQATYVDGTSVQLAAAPSDTAYHFVRWGGDVDGTTTPITYMVRKNSHVTATFASNLYTVTVVLQGSGVVTRTPNQTQAYMHSSYKLAATPSSGYQFEGWTGDVTTIYNPIGFAVDSNMTVTARFDPAPNPVLNLTIVGNGTVARNPDQPDYAPGTDVAVTAMPAAGWRFVGWSGDFVANENPIGVIMDRDKNLTATFAPDGFVLSNPVVGAGTVARSPDQATYHNATPVTVTAVAGSGSHFVSWSGDTTATTNPLALTMTRDRTLQANFGYTVTPVASTSGKITASPQGWLYIAGSSVTLTPQPATGYHFVSWGGDASGSTVPLVMSMTADKSVSANYASNLYHIDGTADGSGTVVRIPNQPTYPYGQVVTLAATPAAGWHFTQWTDDVELANVDVPGMCPTCDSPTQNPIRVRAVRDDHLTAVFEQNAFPLIISTDGHGSVSENWQPQPGPDSTVVLEAQAEQGWRFAGWNGDAAGPTNPLRMTLANATTLTARFVRDGADSTAVTPAAAAGPTAIVAFALLPITPNPAFGHAQFTFDLPRDAAVSVEVLDVQGRRIATVANGSLAAGRHQASWNGASASGRALEPGMFFARFHTPDGVFTRRFVFTP